MTRYVAMQRRPRAWYENDDLDEPLRVQATVDDHEPCETGLVDVNGIPIMRLPNPLGFGRDDEW